MRIMTAIEVLQTEMESRDLATMYRLLSRKKTTTEGDDPMT